MKYSFTSSIFLIVAIMLLSISCSDNIQDSQEVEEIEPPNLKAFTESDDFKTLVNASENMIKVHDDYFQQIPENKKSVYIDKLDNLTKILRENPTEKNLKNFVDHTGFNDLSEFMDLFETQKRAKKHLNEKFPSYAKLDQSQKKKFLVKANLMFRNKKDLDLDIVTGSNCAAQRSAEIRSAEAEAYVGIIACGATAGASASILGPIGAGAVYGACAGAIYSKRDADLELAQLNYEECISNQQ